MGPRTSRALINQYGGAAAALDALPDLARRGGRLMLKVYSRAEAEKEMAAAARLGVRFIAMGEPDYPKTLQAIDTAPPWSRFAATLRCWPNPPSPSSARATPARPV